MFQVVLLFRFLGHGLCRFQHFCIFSAKAATAAAVALIISDLGGGHCLMAPLNLRHCICVMFATNVNTVYSGPFMWKNDDCLFICWKRFVEIAWHFYPQLCFNISYLVYMVKARFQAVFWYKSQSSRYCRFKLSRN